MRRALVMIGLGLLWAALSGAVGSGAVAHAASSCSNQWQIQASSSPGNYANQLLAVTALSATDAWSVGYSVQSATSNGQTTYTYDPLFEHWDGAAWSLVPGATQGLPVLATTVPGEMRGVWGSGPSDVWAVGDSGPQGTETALIEHWNGSAWSVATPSSGTAQLNAVWGSSASDVWAVGQSANGVTQHWNGSAWQTVPGADSSVRSWVSVSGTATGDVWAVGNDASLATTATTEHWDGAHWAGAPVPPPLNDNLYATAITATATGVWLDGTGQATQNGTVVHPYVTRWTGSSWAYVTTPGLGRHDVLLGAAASDVSDAWFVGGYSKAVGGGDPFADTPEQLDARHWDGNSLSFVPPVASAAGGDGFNAVATTPGQTWAVGFGGMPHSGGPQTPTQTLIEAICAAPAAGVVPEAPAVVWLPLAAIAVVMAMLTRTRRAPRAS